MNKNLLKVFFKEDLEHVNLDNFVDVINNHTFKNNASFNLFLNTFIKKYNLENDYNFYYLLVTCGCSFRYYMFNNYFKNFKKIDKYVLCNKKLDIKISYEINIDIYNKIYFENCLTKNNKCNIFTI